jgi:PST family polysaccharide transporter
MRKFREILARRHNVRAHFWQTCANYTQQIFGLALGILLARLLSPEAFGDFAYTTAVVGIFLLPASWSLAPQVVAEVHENPGVVDDALWVSRRVLAARAALGMSACIFLAATRGVESAFLGAVVGVPLVCGEFIAILRASLEGYGVFKWNFYDSLLAAAATVLLGLPSAWMGAGVWALALPAIPLFVVQLWFFTRCSGRGLRPRQPKSTRRYFRSGCALWISSSGEGLLFKADKFMLGNFSTLSAVGDYNRAFNYAPLSARALNSFLTNPTVAGLVRAKDNNSRSRLLLKSAIILLLGGVANYLVLLWLSAPIVPRLFGEQWVSAIPVFEAMAPMSLAMSLAYLPTALTLAVRDYFTLAWVRSLSLVVFVSGSLWVGHLMTAVTVAVLLQICLAFQGVLLIASQVFRRRTSASCSAVK